MAGTILVREADPLASLTDWTRIITNSSKMRKGAIGVDLTHWSQSDESKPAIHRSGFIEVNGSIIRFTSETTVLIDPSAIAGTLYLVVDISGSSVQQRYVNTAPTWNSVLRGWYDSVSNDIRYTGHVMTWDGALAFTDKKEIIDREGIQFSYAGQSTVLVPYNNSPTPVTLAISSAAQNFSIDEQTGEIIMSVLRTTGSPSGAWCEVYSPDGLTLNKEFYLGGPSYGPIIRDRYTGNYINLTHAVSPTTINNARFIRVFDSSGTLLSTTEEDLLPSWDNRTNSWLGLCMDNTGNLISVELNTAASKRRLAYLVGTTAAASKRSFEWSSVKDTCGPIWNHTSNTLIFFGVRSSDTEKPTLWIYNNGWPADVNDGLLKTEALQQGSLPDESTPIPCIDPSGIINTISDVFGTTFSKVRRVYGEQIEVFYA